MSTYFFVGSMSTSMICGIHATCMCMYVGSIDHIYFHIKYIAQAKIAIKYKSNIHVIVMHIEKCGLELRSI